MAGLREAAAATIGVFDGVHLGHRSLLERTAALARRDGLMSVAVTFDRNPLEVVRPDVAPLVIQSLDDKVAHLQRHVDVVHVLHFDLAFADQAPEAFVEAMLSDVVRIQHVVVGANFRFGRGAVGDVDWLREHGRAHGINVEGVDLVDHDGRTISSTAIRGLVREGDVVAAASLLGRPFSVRGPVVRGEQRGRTIGFPTANVELPERRLRPAVGVYAGHAHVGGAIHAAVTNVGRRPTFEGDGVTIEAHLLDVDLDLYGADLEITFEHRLRDEVRFDGVEALTAQIARDRDRARELVS